MAIKTKLILREDHPELGNTGDVVEVSPGYARNYLLPRGLAYAFSEDAILRIEKARLEAEAHRAAVRADMESVAKRLASIGAENTEDNRRGWRQLLFTTEGFGEFMDQLEGVFIPQPPSPGNHDLRLVQGNGLWITLDHFEGSQSGS